jgi:hypothetical protein
MAHTGKIGRLPAEVRAELNRRMNNNERTEPLLGWLNGLPEVQRVLAELFGGKPISQQNLSQWRQGGFHEWQKRLEAAESIPELMREMKKWELPNNGSLGEVMRDWMAAHLLVTASQTVQEMPGNVEKVKLLRSFCLDAVALQRSEYRSGKLKLDQDSMAFKQEAKKQILGALLEGVKVDESKTN